MKDKNQGFTLVEMIIVIAIIAVLSAIVIAKVSGSRKNTNYLKRLSDLNQINLSLQRYNAQNYGKWPSTSGVWYSTHTCAAVSATATTTGYVPALIPTFIAQLPLDPDKATNCTSGPVYMYKSDGRNYKLIVYNDSKDTDVLLQKNKNMVDPMRVSTSSTPSFGVWSPGGAGY